MSRVILTVFVSSYCSCVGNDCRMNRRGVNTRVSRLKVDAVCSHLMQIFVITSGPPRGTLHMTGCTTCDAMCIVDCLFLFSFVV